MYSSFDTIQSMKLENLPDFAKPYKKRGYDVKLNRGRYQLFRVTSVRVEGIRYPRPVPTYLGTIDPDRGFIPARRRDEKTVPAETVEYGLSHFVIKHFRRSICRSVYCCDRKLFCMGLLHYLYGHVDERIARLSHIHLQLEDMPEISGPNAMKRITNVSSKIAERMADTFTEPSDLAYVTARLREIRVSPAEARPQITWPDDLISIFTKYGIKP